MKKILVIEDEAAVRANVLQILDSGGYQGIGVEDGSAGLELARRELPDLIVCDIMMPGMDGYALLQALRADPTTAAIPLIFLTAKVDRSDVRQGMDLGADDYLSKPFRRRDLLHAIDARLRRRAELLQQAERRLDELRTSINLALPHELRTALTGILGFSELIGAYSDVLALNELAEMGRAIYESSSRLQHLLDNFLLYARLELLTADTTQLLDLRQARTPDASAIVEAVAMSKAQSYNRSPDLTVRAEPCTVAMSGAFFRKLCEELLDNAFKYSRPGTSVAVTLKAAGPAQIVIEDAGCGMTAQQLAEIGAYVQFERQTFERRGVGLGLVISKRLAAMHGGRLQIASQAGVGTNVSVELPLAEESAPL